MSLCVDCQRREYRWVLRELAVLIAMWLFRPMYWKHLRNLSRAWLLIYRDWRTL